LSATSKPDVTCSTRRLGSRGMARGRLATSVTVTPVRSAARKRISLMTFGQASASTQMLAVVTLAPIAHFGCQTTIYGAARRRFTITLSAIGTIEGLTDSLAVQLAPLGVQVSVVEPGNYRGNIDKNMLARLPEAEKEKIIKAFGSKLAAAQYPEPTDVALAVEQALFEPSPKRRYVVVTNDPHIVERTIRKQIEQLVQLNEGQPYTYDRADLMRMLDEALASSRPRTKYVGFPGSDTSEQ